MKRLLILLLATASAFGTAYTATGNVTLASSTNWSPAAIPGSGDTVALAGHTLTITANGIVGNSPSSGNVISGGTVVNNGFTLIVQGGMAGSYQPCAASTLKFDSTNASAPTTTHYNWDLSSASLTACSGTPPSPSSPATITANTSTGAAFTISNASGPATINITGGGLIVSNFGYNTGAPVFGWTLTANAANSVTLKGKNIFDTTCGIKWLPNGADVRDFDAVSFKHTIPGCYPWYIATNNNKTTGTRNFNHSVFDLQPHIDDRDAIYDSNFFPQGWIDGGIFSDESHPYLLTNGVTVDFNVGTTYTQQGITGAIMQNEVLIGDSSTKIVGGVAVGATPLYIGTASSSTSNTLTVSGTPWTVNAYKSVASSTVNNSAYFVSITGGTGAGQVRPIATNTSNVLTNYGITWDTNPDATSTFAIYAGIYNPHWTSGPHVATGQTLNFTGNYFALDGAADNNGDDYHSMACGSAGGIYVYDRSINFPSIAHDNSGTFITVGSDVSNVCLNNATHTTSFTGSQSNFAMNEGSIDTNPHTVGAFLSSISWNENRTYNNSGLKQWALLDEVLSTGGTDLVNTNCSFGGFTSCADYNADFNQLQTGRAATDQPGSNPAYNVKTTVVMGQHDVRNTDPQFLNKWASIQSWYKSLGHDASVLDPIQILPDAYNCLASQNDFAGPQDVNCTPANLYAYLTNAMSPTNAALHNTAHDGTDIGAVAYSGGLTLSSIAISPTAPSLTVGSTQTFTAICTWSDTLVHPCPTLTWNSSNTAHATINPSTGVATAIASGTSNITATGSSITSNTAVLTVTAVTLSSIALTPNPIVIYQGYPVQLTATCTYSSGPPADCTSAITTWTSTNTSLATVSSTGLVTSFTGLIRPGFGGITATLSGVTSPSDSIAPWLLSNITLAPSLPRFLLIGNTQTYVATCQFSDATTRDCTPQVGFNSSNTGAVTVAGATATAVGTGSSNITAAFIGRTSPASVINVITRGHTGFARGTGIARGTRIQ